MRSGQTGSCGAGTRKEGTMLEGISGNVNVVAYPIIRTKVDKPTTFRMSVYYRTEGDA